MKKPIFFLISLVGVLGMCLWALLPESGASDSPASLTVYCAASFRAPMTEIVADYERETGQAARVVYNGSGALLTQLKLGGGDIFMPANASYIEDAAQDDLIAGNPAHVTQMTAVIVVRKENSTIHSLNDLTRQGVRISFADQSAAIGTFTRSVLRDHNMLKAIEKNVTVTKPTVSNITEDVALGSVDACIAWDTVAQNYPQLKTINTRIFDLHPRNADIAILRASTQPESAQRFIKFLTSENHGLLVFKKFGFKVTH